MARHYAQLSGVVFFDSAQGRDPTREDATAFSLLAASPSRVIKGRTDEDWERLRAAVVERQQGEGCVGGGALQGFAAGWVEYDGSFCFGFYDHPLVYRHGEAGGAGEWQGQLPEIAALSDVSEKDAAPSPVSVTLPPSEAAGVPFQPVSTREAYMAGVERAQAYIAAGDIYQVNLTHRFTAPWQGDAFAFYEALRRCSPAPYAAYLSLEGRTILSSSPELFLKISGRQICTRPIKGTRPRRSDAEADARSAAELVSSAKEAAELIMITDLERNDLGQICEFGSVAVKELLKLERFEQVFHLVSTVEGRLRPEVDAVTALRACFPGGSITGAPKKRAREIIAEIECEPRGLYTGAVGYFGFNGESQFNIAIRTVVIEGGDAHFHVGAGIVADSVPAQEWQETLDKAAGILLAAQELGRAT